MYLTRLKNMDPWEWPEDAGAVFLQTVLDPNASLEDRMLAAELGADPVAINDELAQAFLQVAMNADEPEELRRRSLAALGPALELADLEGFDFLDDSPITQDVFQSVQDTLHALFHDPDVPKGIRRNALESSVRAESDWHEEAIQQAYSSNDPEWKLTAVFCMGYVRGFEREILESLESPEEMIHYHAVQAAGNWELAEAWEEVHEVGFFLIIAYVVIHIVMVFVHDTKEHHALASAMISGRKLFTEREFQEHPESQADEELE